jgi:putative polyketide hydroxylase
MHTEAHTYDVLIAGAGPAGLATAISAARHGARVLVVERHATTSIHPRATGISTRTMEIFRGWGIADAVRAVGVDVSIFAAAGQTLADPGLTPVPSGYPSPREALAVSPAVPACSPQDHIEPLLVEQVRRLGGEVRFSTELGDLRTGRHGVRATLTDRRTGTARTVRARYVVGADGPRSTVRAALGIGVEHLGTMGEFVQVQFRSDLGTVVGSRRHALYIIGHPEAEGLILPFGSGRWGYAKQYFPERGESAADFTRARWTELLRIAAGVPALQPEIIGDASFTLAAEMATAFRAGRGFLAGDAAHRMTPVGGVGMNTAIHDGHNLGWKLAWAARGLAGEELLDSYAEERRPVGLRNTLRSLRRGEPDPSDGLPGDLGSRYDSAVIAAADVEPPATGFASPDLDGAAPGERAPHVWILHGGRRRSTLDLFDGQLTLLIGRRGRGWRRAAARLADTGLPIAGLTGGVDIAEADGRLALAYRIGETGAVLVRPDGYVAWRCDVAAAHPVTTLESAVGAALGRTPVRAALAG